MYVQTQRSERLTQSNFRTLPNPSQPAWDAAIAQRVRQAKAAGVHTGLQRMKDPYAKTAGKALGHLIDYVGDGRRRRHHKKAHHKLSRPSLKRHRSSRR